MSVSVEFLPGPLTSEASRSQAEQGLRQHPAIQKGASFALEQLEGRWVASIVHQAGPPPFEGGGNEGGSEEAPSAPPKEEGGSDDGPPSDDGGDSKPPGEDGGDNKSPHDKGAGGELHQVMSILTQICDALGIPVGMGADPMGGDPMGGGGPPGLGGPPAGPGGPPMGPPGAGGPPHGGLDQTIHHQRAMKPGETPPGGTPLGAPAFASVRKDHPWAHVAGTAASFEVSDVIGNIPLTQVKSDLTSLASELGGYRVARLREATDDSGNRCAVAVITAH